VISVGAQLGPYRLDAKLGAGGMGEVFLARHVEIGRTVALKLLHERHQGNEVMHERFVREARLANRVRHENVVEVTELAQLPDGRPYMVMELIDGAELHSLWERGLDLRTFVDVAGQIAGALEAAHRVGVVHRDLKPQNLFVSPREFGAARVLNEDDRLTRTGDVIATASYMSPEQAMGEPVDARSDVYSLGVVLWELIVGERPFVGRSFGEYVLLHAQRAPEAPSKAGACQLQGGISPALDAVLLTCLAKRPEHRYASAAELRRALEALVAPPRRWSGRGGRSALVGAAVALSIAAAVFVARVPAAQVEAAPMVAEHAPIVFPAPRPVVAPLAPEEIYAPTVVQRRVEARPRLRQRKTLRTAVNDPISASTLKDPFGGAP
jgi:serine/threonine-protein kinase